MSNYWLMKSEPGTYSIDHLKRDKRTYWEGVRNFQARNFLRDEIKAGDQVLFYHSNAEPPGIAGIAKVVKSGYPDPSQYDSKSKYFDSRSKKDKPLWYVVDIEFKQKFKALLSLETLRGIRALESMKLMQKGQRLSVQPVSAKEWVTIQKLSQS